MSTYLSYFVDTIRNILKLYKGLILDQWLMNETKEWLNEIK